ncbi:MAG: acetyl-CoA carboxylase biotin carboxyl carrier protein subunit [Clostridiales bacterium]|nr:acetyl-CoA carboxylase biotin carboxyl carrier protein subunit [Clostridiales bacterium]
MKKYNVKVNGNLYEIEIEEIDAASAAQSASKAAPAQSSAPANGEKVTAPMPGNILSVKVSNGQSVKKGDLLMVLEAMKMENEIMAPCDGKISSLNVQKGSTVNSGDLLCSIT